MPLVIDAKQFVLSPDRHEGNIVYEKSLAAGQLGQCGLSDIRSLAQEQIAKIDAEAFENFRTFWPYRPLGKN
jgi:hypothetical protein